jgi:hypothetical protein
MEVDGSVAMEGEVATIEEEAATMEEVVPAVQPEENATMEEEAATMEGEAATMACEEVAVVISVKVEPEDNNGEPVVDVIDVDAIAEAEQMEVDQELEKGKVRRSPDRPWGGQVGGRPWRGQAGHVHKPTVGWTSQRTRPQVDIYLACPSQGRPPSAPGSV